MRYDLPPGKVERFQKSASTFAGMTTIFCKKLGSAYSNLAVLLGQFQDRLTFGVQQVLLDLLQNLDLKPWQARILYEKGFHEVDDLARTDVAKVVAPLKEGSKKLKYHKAMSDHKFKCLAERIIKRAKIVMKQKLHTEDTEDLTQAHTTLSPQTGASVTQVEEEHEEVELTQMTQMTQLTSASQPYAACNPCLNAELWDQFLADWQKEPTWSVAFQYEEDKGAIIAVSVMWERKTCWHIPLAGANSEVFNAIQAMMCDSKACKITVDAKQAWMSLQRQKINFTEPIFDVGVAMWLINPDSINKCMSVEELYDKCTSMTPSGLLHGDQLQPHSPEQCQWSAYWLLIMHPGISQKLENAHLGQHFHEVEMALTSILGEMETKGVEVDVAKCQQQITILTEYQEKIQTKACELAGQLFSLSNPKEVSEVLYIKLKLKPTEAVVKSNGNKYSTKSEFLLDLIEQGHQLPLLILNWRKINRNLGGYCSQIKRAVHLQGVDGDHGKIGACHSLYSRHVVWCTLPVLLIQNRSHQVPHCSMVF